MHFLASVFSFLTSRANWSGPDGILVRAGLQVELAAMVTAVAAVVGVSGGFALGHYRKGALLAVNAANAARAVPTLALLTLLAIQPSISFQWNGFLASGIALVVLAVPPVLTNAYVGLREVDPEANEAARALGLSGSQRFWKVEVPLALPLAVAGIRTAAVEVVATATLAAFVSFNDLGTYIFAGLNTQDNVETFAGAFLVAALAAAADLGLATAFWLVVPASLRRTARDGSPVLARARPGRRGPLVGSAG